MTDDLASPTDAPVAECEHDFLCGATCDDTTVADQLVTAAGEVFPALRFNDCV